MLIVVSPAKTLDYETPPIDENSQAYTEGPIGPYNIYRISAQATFASYGSPDFISRRAEMKVGFP